MTLPTSPSLDAARAELAAWVEAARTAWNAQNSNNPPWVLPATESDNRNLIDLASAAAQKPFLCWEIEFGGGGQASLGPIPVGRQFGQLRLTAKVKEGSGVSDCLKLLDFVLPYVHFKDGTVVRAEVGTVVPGTPKAGWAGKTALITFWIDYQVISAP